MSDRHTSFVRILFWSYLIALSILLLIPLPAGTGTGGSDKTMHFSAFLILGTLHYLVFKRNKKAFGLLIVYACLIESVQGLTTYRSFEWLDMLTNLAGCLTTRLFIKSTGL